MVKWLDYFCQHSIYSLEGDSGKSSEEAFHFYAATAVECTLNDLELLEMMPWDLFRAVVPNLDNTSVLRLQFPETQASTQLTVKASGNCSLKTPGLSKLGNYCSSGLMSIINLSKWPHRVSNSNATMWILCQRMLHLTKKNTAIFCFEY